MDTGHGKFEQVTAPDEGKLKVMQKALEERYPKHGGWFREGEIIEIRGSTFRISAVKPTQLRLKLLKRNDS